MNWKSWRNRWICVHINLQQVYFSPFNPKRSQTINHIPIGFHLIQWCDSRLQPLQELCCSVPQLRGAHCRCPERTTEQWLQLHRQWGRRSLGTKKTKKQKSIVRWKNNLHVHILRSIIPIHWSLSPPPPFSNYYGLVAGENGLKIHMWKGATLGHSHH
jgi:hypothetical protein